MFSRVNDNLEAQARSIIAKINENNERASEHEIIRISDLCRANQSNISKEQQKKKVIYLDTGSITKNYIVDFQSFAPNSSDLPSRCKRRVKHSDIVYSTVRPNLCHHGIILNPQDNLIVSTGFTVLSAAQERVSNEIVYLLITQDQVQTLLQNIAEMSVSTYPSIDVDDLLNLEFEIPLGYDFTQFNDLAKALFLQINSINNEIRMLSNSQNLIVSYLLSSR